MKTIIMSDLIKNSGVAFGTSGARGLVSQLTDDVCAAYALAFYSVIKNTQKENHKVSGKDLRIALGIDLRPSSPRMAKACAWALKQEGINVDFCGALPTPALALYAQSEGIPAIMITGSHIPFDRNGIKFYRADGEITKVDEQAISQAKITIKDTYTEANAESNSELLLSEVNNSAINLFADRYTDFFPRNCLEGLHLGIYEHSSVARDVLRQILEKLGARVTSLNRTNEFVPIDTEAVTEADIKKGREWSARYHFDAIISTDGDGDRPLIGDENGVWLRGDIVGLICARFLGAKNVVVPISCNTAIEKSGNFKNVLRTKIGSPYVIEGMQKLTQSSGDSTVGFEANGGFLVGSEIIRDGKKLAPLPTRDSILPALAVLVEARLKNIKISELSKNMPARFTASERLQNFSAEKSHELMGEINLQITQLLANPALSKAGILNLINSKVIDCNTLDGLRMSFENNEIVHLRQSGNAPELRCYCEASSPERAQLMVRDVLGEIGSFDESVRFKK